MIPRQEESIRGVANNRGLRYYAWDRGPEKRRAERDGDGPERTMNPHPGYNEPPSLLEA